MQYPILKSRMKHSKHYIISLLLLFFYAGYSVLGQPKIVNSNDLQPKKGQETPSISLSPKEIDAHLQQVKVEPTEIPEEFSSALDYLLENWAIDKSKPSKCKSLPNPDTNDAEYKNRLTKLPHEIEMPFNSAVKSFIEIYTQKRRNQVEYLLGLSGYYFPIFEVALEKEGIPLELKCLPIIESALNPRAVSRAGATGIWQFMLATGRMYNLEVNTLVDERMDPIKSSKVAAKYLKDLYSIYSDWHLAIAAYNCGPGNVNKAIRRAGGEKDFWKIYPFLPAETRAYVPIFIAANYTMSFSKEHNLCPAQIRIPLVTDTILVRQRVHFEQISKVLNIPIEEIRTLNPQYRKDIVPGDIKPYPINLPHNYANLFIDRSDSIYAYKANELVSSRREEVEIVEDTQKNNQKNTGRQSLIKYHTVKQGQTISGIAARYGISQAQLKKANNLKSNNIRAGQRLKIPK